MEGHAALQKRLEWYAESKGIRESINIVGVAAVDTVGVDTVGGGHFGRNHQQMKMMITTGPLGFVFALSQFVCIYTGTTNNCIFMRSVNK